jgi:hypothetical protein
MLTDQELQRELAGAFHERADRARADAIDARSIFRQGIHWRRRRVTAIAAAATAAAALTAGVLVARPGESPRQPGPGFAPPGLLLDAAVARPQPVTAADRGMPRYYVIADRSQPFADVRSSTTGKTLSTVPLPAGTDPKLTQIAAAGDGRTFVLAVFSSRTSFYRLRVTAGGHLARLSPLPVAPLPAGEYASAVAVSPGGGKLAVAIQLSGGQHGAVEVATVATGAIRRWTTTRPGSPTQLSWAGRDLGFFWTDGEPAATSAAGLWALDTTAPGSALMSARRILPVSAGGDTVQSALLDPDGTTATASVTYDGTSHVSRGTVVGGIVRLSIRTGRPLRTLLAEHAAYSADPGQPGWYITACELTAIDPSGGHLLVSCDRFGRLDRARFTALPGSPPQTAIAAAW